MDDEGIADLAAQLAEAHRRGAELESERDAVRAEREQLVAEHHAAMRASAPRPTG